MGVIALALALALAPAAIGLGLDHPQTEESVLLVRCFDFRVCTNRVFGTVKCVLVKVLHYISSQIRLHHTSDTQICTYQKGNPL